MYIENSTIKKQFSIWLLTMLLIISIIIIVGGLTRLTDSGLSITTWDVVKGILPPLNNEDWNELFNFSKATKYLEEYILINPKDEIAFYLFQSVKLNNYEIAQDDWVGAFKCNEWDNNE